MLDWLRRARRKPAALTGAPTVRRLKTYSAQSGYVYQYFYEGHRNSGQGTEFVFSVSADRKSYLPISVVVNSAAAEEWEKAHGRGLEANERYAIAKIALFRAFDERETPGDMERQVLVRSAELELILDTLEID